MENEKRQLELSNKILLMGNSLIGEGIEKDNYTVTQCGTIMIMLSALLLSEQDMFIFSELTAMFSAKKILDAEENINPIENEIFANMLMDKKSKVRARKSFSEKPIPPPTKILKEGENPKKTRRKKGDEPNI